MVRFIPQNHHYPQNIYPCQHLGLNDLKGELWKAVLGYEGCYEVSNFGRVKSLDREVLNPKRGITLKVRGRILRQSAMSDRNIKTGEPSISLRTILAKQGTKLTPNVRRLVYAAFIDSTLDFKKDGLNVVNKDGDGYNNRFDNLILLTGSGKVKRAYKRGRIDSCLKTADRSLWTKPHGEFFLRKPVDQYNLKGKLIAKYESIRAAQRETGLHQNYIIATAKGRRNDYSGFIWKYSSLVISATTN